MYVAPVPPSAGPLAEVLTTLRAAVLELANPTKPGKVFAIASTALPPASDHPDTVVRLTDLNILAASDGTDWIRQDDRSIV